MTVSKSETGHAKNVALFEDLISFCIAYGPAYRPSRPSLETKSMELLLAEARNAIALVAAALTGFNNATNSRMLLFKPLKSLATRLVNALAVSNASAETIKDAISINKKLQGIRATPKAAEPATGSNLPAEKTISSSQQSYTYLVEHFPLSRKCSAT